MIGCIIQARMGSTRLPGKVMELLDDKNSSLHYTINQLKNSLNLNKIIVATTELEEDDIIEKISKDNEIECFRGSSENVLERFYECAKKFQLESIVRITADCPLIDPKIVDSIIEIFNLKQTFFLFANQGSLRALPHHFKFCEQSELNLSKTI